MQNQLTLTKLVNTGSTYLAEWRSHTDGFARSFLWSFCYEKIYIEIFNSCCDVAVACHVSEASSDMFLKIEDMKGESQIAKSANGACVVPALTAGNYTVQTCDATGKVSMQDMHMVHSIVSPRNPASGMSSGKRMHQPIRIYQKIDKSTPVIYNLKINGAGSQVVIGVDDASVDAV